MAVTAVPKGEREWGRKIFDEIMAGNSSNLI